MEDVIGRLEGSDMDTDMEEDLEMGKMAAAVDATEAVTKTAAETAPSMPSQHSPAMKIVSDEEFDKISDLFEVAGANWRGIVAELDTVCIQRASTGHTLLHCSATNHCRDFTAYLLDAGVPADAKTTEGDYPLMAAAWRGDLGECKLLCKYGADINFSHDDKSTMLMALQSQHYDIVDWLMQHFNYRLKWDQPFFKNLCRQHPELVVPYLDLFAEELPPQSAEYLDKMSAGTVTDFRSRSGVKYRHLEDIYGHPKSSVQDTALALVLKSPVACDALACKVMRHIIKAKWLAFGRTMYRQEVALYTLLVVSFSISIVWEKNQSWNQLKTSRQKAIGINRIIAAIFSLLLLLRVERREAIVEGPAYILSFWNLLGAGTYVGIIIIVIIQACGSDWEYLHLITGVLNITLWVNMYQYLQMTENFAVLVTMMSQMMGDVGKFILLYSLFLFGFSGGFFLVLRSQPGYETFIDTLITVMIMLFGQIDYAPFKKVKGVTRLVANALLLAYLVSVVIVLMNLLIAMMSTSYANVWEKAEGQVLRSYTQNIIRMEQSVTRVDREKQFEMLKTDVRSLRKRAQKANHKATHLRHAKFLRQQTRQSLGNISPPSLLPQLLMGVFYLVVTLQLLVKWLCGGSSQSHQKSLVLRANAITNCSTLEDGERWEVVRQKTSEDHQTELNSRVEKLTSLVEMLVKEPREESDQRALMEQQTALINEQKDAIRRLADLLRAAEAKTEQPSPLPV